MKRTLLLLCLLASTLTAQRGRDTDRPEPEGLRPPPERFERLRERMRERSAEFREQAGEPAERQEPRPGRGLGRPDAAHRGEPQPRSGPRGPRSEMPLQLRQFDGGRQAARARGEGDGSRQAGPMPPRERLLRARLRMLELRMQRLEHRLREAEGRGPAGRGERRRSRPRASVAQEDA